MSQPSVQLVLLHAFVHNRKVFCTNVVHTFAPPFRGVSLLRTICEAAFFTEVMFCMWQEAGFLTETYQSILLQRLTHNDGVQGVVRRGPLATGATTAGQMYLPVALPRKCLPTVRAIEPCRRW